jgi:hypothetical protein
MRQIMVAFTAGDTPALGRVWRITAKITEPFSSWSWRVGHGLIA